MTQVNAIILSNRLQGIPVAATHPARAPRRDGERSGLAESASFSTADAPLIMIDTVVGSRLRLQRGCPIRYRGRRLGMDRRRSSLFALRYRLSSER